MHLYGIIAQFRRSAGDLTAYIDTAPTDIGDGVGEALINFWAGTVKIAGVTYAFEDVFDDAPLGGTAQLTSPSRITPERGYLSNDQGTSVGAVAAGALATIMLAPHTAFMEIEDLDNYNTCGFFFQGFNLRAGIFCTDAYSYINMPDNVTFLNWYHSDNGNSWAWAGVNRIAYTIGNAYTTFTYNGTTCPAVQDSTGFFDPIIDAAAPLGAYEYNDVVHGFIRWIAIKPAITNTTELVTRTTLITPRAPDFASITTSSTSTTITLTIAPLLDATKYEYLFNYPYDDNYNWQPVESDVPITGLTPSTSYDVYVRGANQNGPGPYYDNDGYAQYTVVTTS